MALNRTDRRVAACRHDATVGDAFETMAKLADRGETYDLVVIDPPSFAARQANVARALRAYGRLTELGVSLLVDGGTLVQASCSSRITAPMFHEQVLQQRSIGGGAARRGRPHRPRRRPSGHLSGGRLPEGRVRDRVVSVRRVAPQWATRRDRRRPSHPGRTGSTTRVFAPRPRRASRSRRAPPTRDAPAVRRHRRRSRRRR